jgi:hypothetical protein
MVWGAIVKALGGLGSSWVDLKKVKYEAEGKRAMAQIKQEGDWDLEAMRQAEHSWKDEFITIIWFAPLIVAWFEQEKATAWLAFVSGLPMWYQIGMFGIIAASFGLRWFFKQQKLKIGMNK